MRAAVLLGLALLAATALARTPTTQGRRECGGALDYQVRLDRIGFSPGEIDGRFGRNTRAALRVFQQVAGLPATGSPDCATWQRLNARGDVPTLIEYHVGEQDLAGPFADQIPSDLAAQAALPALSYASPLEGIAERFHAAPALLRRLNQGVQLEAGATLHVPNVLPDLNAAAVAPGAASTPQDYTVEVSQRGSSLVLRDAGGQVVYFAPATVGSRHDPLPIGDWEVTVVNWNPVFHARCEWQVAHAVDTLSNRPACLLSLAWQLSQPGAGFCLPSPRVWQVSHGICACLAISA
jgi:peptidoglycan hydrolase-like protein with peptidoglycan-binding domain